MTPFPQPEFVKTNGIDMAIYCQGQADGLPIILCHGFPELAFSWRHQLPALSQAGFRAIAPDQRGYGRTECPTAIEAYDLRHLTADMVGLLDALGHEKAVFCGHDWGGFVAWAMPLLYPERVAGVIGLNTPFWPRSAKDPIESARARMGDDMYIVYFQQPGAADSELDQDPARALRFFLRRSRKSGGKTARPFDVANLELMKMFRRPEETWPGEVLLNQQELDTYVSAFRASGFTGGLNWYRNMSRNWRHMEGLTERVDVPCLMISAANDVVLPPSLTEGMERFCPDLTKHVIENSGHWTQQEQPGEVNRLMIDWLGRRFS